MITRKYFTIDTTVYIYILYNIYVLIYIHLIVNLYVYYNINELKICSSKRNIITHFFFILTFKNANFGNIVINTFLLININILVC